MAWAEPSISYYQGTAFNAAGRELYTESHWNEGASGEATRLTLFSCPDGKAFARKQVEDAGQAETPLFELDDGRYGYREGVRVDAQGQREVFVRRRLGQTEKSALVESMPRMVIDAGFDHFIVTHWDALVAGERQRVEFLLPSRLRTYPFVLIPLAADEIDGTPVQRFRLELDSWFSFALPSINIAYSSATKTIRQYSGVSNIRDQAGKNLKVRVEYLPIAPSNPGDSQALATARLTPLDGRCKL